MAVEDHSQQDGPTPPPSRTGPPPAPPEPGPAHPTHENTLAEGAQVHGTAIQAGTVHGSIHVHAAPAPPPAPARPALRQLPPVPANFTGRTADLSALSGLLDQKPAHAPLLLVVSGPAGIGKTTLVCNWLHTVARQFPDGQLYADLHGHAVVATGGDPPDRVRYWARSCGRSVPDRYPPRPTNRSPCGGP